MGTFLVLSYSILTNYCVAFISFYFSISVTVYDSTGMGGGKNNDVNLCQLIEKENKIETRILRDTAFIT
jgi:hypothetical protein